MLCSYKRCPWPSYANMTPRGIVAIRGTHDNKRVPSHHHRVLSVSECFGVKGFKRRSPTSRFQGGCMYRINRRSFTLRSRCMGSLPRLDLCVPTAWLERTNGDEWRHEWSIVMDFPYYQGNLGSLLLRWPPLIAFGPPYPKRAQNFFQADLKNGGIFN